MEYFISESLTVAINRVYKYLTVCGKVALVMFALLLLILYSTCCTVNVKKGREEKGS